MKQKGINVLSLFDGISGARLALKKAGIEVNKYYSSEIDPAALTVQDRHYGKDKTFVKVGDVRKIRGKDFADTDLVIFGSPCTQLTSVNKFDRSGLKGSDSGLFYEAVRIIKEIKKHQPKNKKLYILAENVASMRNVEREKITAELAKVMGEPMEPILIDSSLVSPAHRRRYYWTNIPGVTQPLPTGIKFQDILECGFTDKEKGNVLLSNDVTLTNGIFRHYKRKIGNIIFKHKSFAKLPEEKKLELYPAILQKSKHSGKSKSASCEYAYVNGCYRHPSIVEYSRMMTIPDQYVDAVPGISKTDKLRLIGLGFTVDVVAHLLKGIRH